jgi:protein-S-isoprenylcysteine O-methyltransferase Ste14
MMPGNHNRKVRQAAAVYFLLQGLVVFLWWALLLLLPSARSYFVLEPHSEMSLLSFWLADLFLLGLGSLVAGWLCLRDSLYLRIGVWFVTGSISYAALYCLAFALFTDVGWLGVLLMFAAMIWSGVFSVGLSIGQAMFRKAAETSANWIVAKTIIQIVIVWSIILGIFPYLITLVEDRVGVARLQFAYQKPLASLLLVTISAFGIWAAVTMSRIGLGTPLPLDHANRLVVSGPYAYVRNPMAVSGIGQGFAVALLLGSPLVVLYAFIGSLIWQLVFRPLEETDLLSRFGEQYEEYRREVKCWIPRATPYHNDGAVDSSNSSVSPSGRM